MALTAGKQAQIMATFISINDQMDGAILSPVT
jgi:hypothetical protein